MGDIYAQQLPGQVDTRDAPSTRDGKTYDDFDDHHLSAFQRRRQALNRALQKYSEDGKYRLTAVDHFVDSNRFNITIALIIVLNAVTIGVETDYGCHGTCSVSERGIWYIIDCVFTFVFLVEMGMKFYAYGCFGYFMSGWNQFDFLLVFFAVVDTGILSNLPNTDLDLKLFTVLRIARIFKLVRLVRLVRAFHELYLIVTGLVDAVKTVFWVFLLMTMILWCLAIFITIIVGQDDDPNMEYDYSQLYWKRHDYWGTCAKSMFSLYQLMTSDGWVSSLARPVLSKYPILIVFFLVSFGVCTLGLLNIIVGVIVENTMAASQQNESKITRMMEKSHKRAITTLRTIFDSADKDKSGTLEREEFNKTMKKRYVKEILALIEIPVNEMHDLFSLLDSDNSGSITIDEFQKGCLLMKGAAKSKEMIQLSMHITSYNNHLDELWSDVKEHNTALEVVLKRLLRMETEFKNSQLPKYQRRERPSVLVNDKIGGFSEERGDEDSVYPKEPEAEPGLAGGRAPDPPPLPPGVEPPPARPTRDEVVLHVERSRPPLPETHPARSFR